MSKQSLNKLIATICAFVTVLLPCGALAAAITFEPTQQTVQHGALVTTAVRISGLSDQSAPALGAFDIGVRFDPLVLAINDVHFGDPTLGDQLDLSSFGTLQSITPPFAVGNLVELGLSEVSLDNVDVLNNLQAGDFVLFELTFEAVGNGVSPLQLAINNLADASGDPGPFVDTSAGSASIAVVPEPNTFALALLALGILGITSLRQLSRCRNSSMVRTKMNPKMQRAQVRTMA